MSKAIIEELKKSITAYTNMIYHSTLEEWLEVNNISSSNQMMDEVKVVNLKTTVTKRKKKDII